MSEETKEMEELEEADKSTAKIEKHPVGDDEQGDPKMDNTKKASPPKAKKSDASGDTGKVEKSEETEVEENVEEIQEMPKLKSEILQGLVDHMKGLKKEDLAKIYGTTVLGEEYKEEEEEDIYKLLINILTKRIMLKTLLNLKINMIKK